MFLSPLNGKLFIEPLVKRWYKVAPLQNLERFLLRRGALGNRNAGPSDPAAIPPAPAIFMKSLLLTPLPFFSSFMLPPQSFSDWLAIAIVILDFT